MALNCPQLKSIVCKVDTNSENYYKLNELLSPLKRFSRLKRLDLTFNGDDSLESFHNNHGDNEITSVVGLENLTHLTLKFNGYKIKKCEQVFYHTIFNMSKLQHLRVDSIIKGTQQTINALCELKHLEKLSIGLDREIWSKKKLPQLEKKLNRHCQNIKHKQILR